MDLRNGWMAGWVGLRNGWMGGFKGWVDSGFMANGFAKVNKGGVKGPLLMK